jgi:hypothetical protein
MTIESRVSSAVPKRERALPNSVWLASGGGQITHTSMTALRFCHHDPTVKTTFPVF